MSGKGDKILLMPCPFCGGTNIHVERNIEDEETYSYICCYDCLGSFWQQEACCDEDNVKAWNRRVPTITVNQNGANNTHITNVGTLTIK